MKRRSFIAGLGAASLLPSLALAQQAKRRIGNLKTAKTLGLEVPARLIQQANE